MGLSAASAPLDPGAGGRSSAPGLVAASGRDEAGAAGPEGEALHAVNGPLHALAGAVTGGSAARTSRRARGRPARLRRPAALTWRTQPAKSPAGSDPTSTWPGRAGSGSRS